jgi:hypothetical protein
MITAPGVPGVAFGTIEDGDGRTDAAARRSISTSLGIPSAWATVDQVHGDVVAIAQDSGHHGQADGLFTTTPLLPLAVGTADCVPVALVGEEAVAIVHAGWRGVASGIVASARDAFRSHGASPMVAVIGPHIGACCYEVGDEVIDAVGGFAAATSWGTRSVDLAMAIEAQLHPLPVRRIDGCTMEHSGFASHRENGTKQRQVSVVWKPKVS